MIGPHSKLSKLVPVLFCLFSLVMVARSQPSSGQGQPANTSQVSEVLARLRSAAANEATKADALALGQVLVGEKRFAEAEQLFRAVLEKSPRDLTALYGAALSVFNQERAREAEALARAAVDVAFPADSNAKQLSREESFRAADAMVLLAIVLAVTGDETGSRQIAEQAAKIASDHFDAQFTLGRALYGSGDTTSAIAAFRRAVTLRPDDRRALFFLGTALERSGDTSEAINTYRQLISKHPRAAEGHLGLGILLVRGTGNQVNEGIKELEQAVALDPNQYEARASLGRALVAKGRALESIAHLVRAAELAPDNPEPHFQLSQAYRRLGKHDLAKKESERVKQIHESRRNPRVRNEVQKTPEQ
jgi:tetratricopeptide (TPR) repeat protein